MGIKPFAFCFLLAACSPGPDAAAPHASLPSPAVPEGIGVNIHFTDPRPGEMEMLAAAGFRWVRMDFGWGRTERERGKYDFTPYERLMAALEKQKIRALFILDYSNRLYEAEQSVATDEGRQAFARWAAAAAAHFKGRGIVWEIWNEPNISNFWKPQPKVEDYAAMALAASRAIREAAPGEAIIGPASSTIDMKFLEGCFKAGLLQGWDAVSVHPYRQTGPEFAEPEYAKLRRLIAQYAPRGKAVPILSGEWGYSAAWKNYDAEKQGKMLPRQWLVNLANQVPLSIWYDWHDDGKDPAEPEHHFGTVAHPYQAGRDPVYDPKPAYRAAKTFTSTLGGFRFVKRIAAGGIDDYAMLFKRGGELRLAVWTTAPEPREVAVPSDKCSFDVVAHTGGSLAPIACDGKTFSVTATDAPQYLIAKGPNPALAAAPAAHPLRVTVSPAAGTALTARVENLGDRAFRGTARLVATGGIDPVQTEQALDFAAGEVEKTLRFPLASKPPGQFGAGLRIERKDGVVIDVPPRRFSAVPDALFTGAKIVGDGDAKVASEQSLALAPAPEPLPDSDAPVMKIAYRMDAGWKFVRVAAPPGDARKIPGEPKAFGLWIHGNAQGGLPRMRVIDATGQAWQPSAAAIDWNGWRYAQFDLKPSTGHWGGANDGVVHFPLKWDSLFLLDKPRSDKAEGTLHIAAPVVIY